MKFPRELISSAFALSLLACGGDQAAEKPAEPAAGTSATPATAGGETTAAAAPAKPTLCDAGNNESEVAEVVLARSGRGLLWLVSSDRSSPDAKAEIARGAEEVRAARAIAECLLKHWDAGFDPTQSQGFNAFEAWVDQHVGPEHAETLLAAGAAYFASLLVAESWIDAALDVPAARLFLERANAANPRLADGLGPLVMGAYLCFVPKAGGGDPDAGLKKLQEAWTHEGSLQLAMKVAAAELCTPVTRDQALFGRLLDEVEKAPVSSSFDAIAKQRAKTLKEEEEDMFPPL